MTDADALLAAILAHPDEDTPRLAYADWLDETAGTVACRCKGTGRYRVVGGGFLGCPGCNGAGSIPDGNAARAEFIRVQVELAATADPPGDRFWDGQLGDGPKWHRRRKALRRREQELLRDIGHDIVNTPRVWPVSMTLGAAEPYPPGLGIEGPPRLVVRRGFVEQWRMTAEDWLAHADQILAHHPLRHVTLTTWPDYAFVGYKTDDDPISPTVVELHFVVAGRGVSIRPRGSSVSPAPAGRVFAARWPGVGFTLPRPEPALRTLGTPPITGRA
jgi:uncharacterized protein (TIGR02996 family)